MREQLGIRQFPKPRTIIGHGIGWARNVVMAGDVAVKPLMHRL